MLKKPLAYGALLMQLLSDAMPSRASGEREDELFLSGIFCDEGLINLLEGRAHPPADSLEGDKPLHERVCALNKDTTTSCAHDVKSTFNEAQFISQPPYHGRAATRHPLTQRRFKRDVLPPELSAVMDLNEEQILSCKQFGACNRSSKSLLHLGLVQSSENLIEPRLAPKGDILASLAGFYYVYLHHGGALRWRSALGVGKALLTLGYDAFAHHYFNRVVKSKCSNEQLKELARTLST